MPEEKQGAPSSEGKLNPKLVALAVIAIIVVASALFFLGQQAPVADEKAFKVLVLGSEGEKVSGALVEVFDGAEKIAEEYTVNGSINLDGLPAKKLTFKVTLPNGESQARLIDAGKKKTLQADFSAEATISPDELPPLELRAEVRVLDLLSKKPIDKADLTYSIGKISKQATTNWEGKAFLTADAGNAVRMRIKAANYFTQTPTIIVTAQPTTVYLKPKPDEAKVTFSEEENQSIAVAGKLSIIAEDAATGAPVPSGRTCAYEAETGIELACAELVEGNAEISGLTVGAKVHYAVMPTKDYYDYSSAMDSPEPITISEQTIATAKMTRIEQALFDSGEKKYTIIRLVDELGAPTNGKISIIPYPSIIAFPAITTTGEAKLKLANTTTYYAIAYAQGRVPVRSEEFKPGTTISLVLKTATMENSAKLSAFVADEDGTIFSGAKVALLSEDLLVLPPALTQGVIEATPTPTPELIEAVEDGGMEATPEPETQMPVFSKPKAEFYNLPLNSDYSLRATYAKGVGSTDVYLTENTEVTITLLANTGFIDVSASNFVDGKPISADFTLYLGEKIADACSGTSCTLKARAGKEGKIIATTNGFASTTRPLTFEDVKAGQTTTISLTMIPQELLNQTIVQFTGLTNADGEAMPESKVKANNSYTANFFLATPYGDKSGFYARIGSANKVADDNAAILDFAAPQGMDMAKSISFNPGASCADLEGNETTSENGEWKWVEISFDGKGTANIAIPFQVRGKASKGDSVVFNYRGYAKTTTTEATVWKRSPEDPAMGTNESTATKAGCYAKTNSTSFEIVSKTTELPGETPKQTEETPEPAAEFTVSDTITFDYENGLRSALGFKKYDLQVDAILPADAMPLKLNSKQSTCKILVSVNSSNPETRKCYGYDNTRNTVFFSSHEFNADCPVQVQGNKFFLNGKEFKGEEKTTLLFQVGGCNVESKLEMPIKLIVAETESIFAAPNGNELGDGDAAKPIYLVNNLQTGNREISAQYLPLEGEEKTKQLLFKSPGAKAIAWRGPGTLNFKEGTELISELYYENPVKQIEAGKGTVGGQRLTSCSDYKCCARGWCGQKALKQAMAALKEKATSLASKTAFRRGGSEPYNYFKPNTDFAFSTVAQGIQGSETLLKQQNVSLTKDVSTTASQEKAIAQCEKEQPAIYELVASGKNAGNLSLSAAVLPLYNNDYLQNCEEKPVEQEFVPLCGYLYGNNSCVAKTNTSNALTTNQLDSLKYKIQLCMYPAVPIVSLPFCTIPCAVASAYSSAEKASICTSICGSTALAASLIPPASIAAGATCQSVCLAKFETIVATTAPTIMYKLNAFTIDGEIPDYGDASEKNAFVKLGNALADAFTFTGNADYELFGNGKGFFDFGSGSCNDITLDFQNQLINAGVGAGIDQVQKGMATPQPGQNPTTGVDPVAMAGGLIDSWLPALAATCTCIVPQSYTDFQVWPPQFGGAPVTGPAPYPQFIKKYTPAPICGGITGTLSTIGGSKPTGTGKAGSININVKGDTVLLRIDLGVDGNCDLIAPWDIDWWKTLKSPANYMSLAGMLLGTNKGDLSLSLSTNVDSFGYRQVKQNSEYKIEETSIGSDGKTRTKYIAADNSALVKTINEDGSYTFEAYDAQGKPQPVKFEDNGVTYEKQTINGKAVESLTWKKGEGTVSVTKQVNPETGKPEIIYAEAGTEGLTGTRTIITDPSGKVTRVAGDGIKVKVGEQFVPDSASTFVKPAVDANGIAEVNPLTLPAKGKTPDLTADPKAKDAAPTEQAKEKADPEVVSKGTEAKPPISANIG